MNYTYLQQVLLNKEIYFKRFFIFLLLQILAIQEVANHTKTENCGLTKTISKTGNEENQVQLRKLSKLQGYK